MSEKDKIFRFKQFEVRNSRSAMRVNTDGVLLGAWSEIPDNATQIWDVGSGTGLIALMLAQRSDATITAFEIDADAVTEMTENFSNSVWHERLTPVYGDFNLLWNKFPSPDLIVSNPPYFDICRRGLKSTDNKRATARHEASLNYKSLIEISSIALEKNGALCIISPADREEDIEFDAIHSGMFIANKVYVRTTPVKQSTRILWRIVKQKVNTLIGEIVIYSETNKYSCEFKQIVKNFYLNIDD